MESIFDILVGILVVSAVILIIMAIIGATMLIIGIVLLSKRKKRIRELEKASHPAFFAGNVADMRVKQEYLKDGFQQYYYAFSLHYTAADGMLHRAFLGVRTLTGMNLQVGSPVQLTVFPEPLIQPSPQALDPMRGADGMLPPQVELCTWMDRPIDETGTVMFSEDYQAALENAHKKNRIALIAGWILIALVVLRTLLVFGSVLTNFMQKMH